MKIAILVDSLSSIAAGSERQIYKLVEGLVTKGHDVRLILLRHTEFSRESLQLSCPVECLHVARILSFRATMKLLGLRTRLINDGVELVHAFFPDACLLAPLYLKHSMLQIITSRRDMGLIYQGKPAWLYRALGHRTDAVVANSRAVADLVIQKEKMPESQCIVIHNGIEPYTVKGDKIQNKLYRREASLKLILVANIKPVKRTLDAVLALREMLITGVDVELALVGQEQDADYVQKINSYIEEYQLEDNVHWPGQVDEPRHLLRQADIGLLISESEGLSNTLMEYLQQGLSPVATNVGGNPELVFHGETGLLVEPGNVEQLVSSIVCLVENPTLKVKVEKLGQKLIEKEFSIASMLKSHEDLYRNLVEQSKGGRVHVEC